MEYISLHIGHAGANIGLSSWDILSREHGINSDGQTETPTEIESHKRSTFFYELERNIWRPRAVFVDLEPLSCSSTDLFDSEDIVVGKEDTGGCWARSYYQVGPPLVELALERIRHQAERADSLSGFILSYSPAGGTGGSIASLLVDSIVASYPRKSLVDVSLASGAGVSSVGAYNTALTAHALGEHIDVSFMLGEGALLRRSRALGVEAPAHRHSNQVASQLVSSLTASVRCGGGIDSMASLQSMMVPFPRIQHVGVSLSLTPSRSPDGTPPAYRAPTASEMVPALFEKDSTISPFSAADGMLMASTIMFRGDTTPSAVNAAANRARARGHLFRQVNWASPLRMAGITYTRTAVPPGSFLRQQYRSALLLFNSSAVRHVWSGLGHRVDQMLSRGAFLHWYTRAGMDVRELEQAREGIRLLDNDYREIEGCDGSVSSSDESSVE
eukprot:gnl/Dysnectes_brevis/10155_a19703_184.p1 GENE.gnl/Dysnectes_brevis/10155_a19703_184~~gnl/Dysnectes_brevis/10155_a19703_184.p1  ORF type:complete len:444 (-),score=72.10 gnl/Dysnectes_brevis/10155_a19703_184:32-1363(-)